MSFRFPRASLLFALVLAAFLVSCDSGTESPPSHNDEPTPTQTVAELIDDNPDLGTFRAALQATDLGKTLTRRSPFSVFAPSDAAFDALLEAQDLTVADLLANDDLSEILAYHIVAAAISTPDLEAGDLFTTEQGGDLEARIDGGIVSLIGATNTVRVSGPPFDATNGVLLVVDGVLLPEGVVLEPKSSTVIGRVVSALEPTQPIEGALVSVVEAGATIMTDVDGMFDFGFAADSSGQPFTLEVTREGFETTSLDFEARLGEIVDLSDIAMTPLFVPFEVIEPLRASQATVDFAAGERVTFTAQFNMQVDWTLEIIGQESGAIKRIRGFSSELTESNASWLGGTTELPLFKGETVAATLLLDGAPLPDSPPVQVLVTTPRIYPGLVVADFEGGDEIEVFNPEFEFTDVGIRGAGDVNMVVPAQGDQYFLLRGRDSIVTNFFVGLVTILPPGGGTFEVPTNIAAELYFNCFLYGFGSPYTIAVVEVVVDGNGTGAYEEIGDTIIPLGGDVEFPNVGVLDYNGWRAYSEPADSFGAFGFGITDAQTQQIVAVRVVLLSDEEEQPTPPEPVGFGIDYITFTAGGPLEL